MGAESIWTLSAPRLGESSPQPLHQPDTPTPGLEGISSQRGPSGGLARWTMSDAELLMLVMFMSVLQAQTRSWSFSDATRPGCEL